MLVALAPFAHAQIYHCIGPHGEQEFTDQPCANPAPSHDANAVADTGFGNVCPGSPTGLRLAVANAFDTHDVNSLAGLILWRGIRQHAAVDRLHSLTHWLKQPLADIALVQGAAASYDETAPPPDIGVDAGGQTVMVMSPPSPPVGLRVSTGGGSGSSRDFGVTEFGGCWWLTF